MRKQLLLLTLPLLLFLSCGSPKGEFAIKRVHDDAYHRVTKSLEFNVSEKIRWVYRFKSAPGEIKVAVFIKKLVLVPVDMETRVVPLDLTTRYIYGTIEDYKPGSYEIILVMVGDNEIIDRVGFEIYQ